MKIIKKYCVFLFFGITGCSFYNNEIHYDTKNNSIVTCNGSVIKSLRISKNEGGYNDRIIKSESKAGREEFFFNKKNLNYERDTKGMYAAKDIAFIPEPNSSYEITNTSQGHRPSVSVTIYTDSLGNIYKADKTHCR